MVNPLSFVVLAPVISMFIKSPATNGSSMDVFVAYFVVMDKVEAATCIPFLFS